MAITVRATCRRSPPVPPVHPLVPLPVEPRRHCGTLSCANVVAVIDRGWSTRAKPALAKTGWLSLSMAQAKGQRQFVGSGPTILTATVEDYPDALLSAPTSEAAQRGPRT
jgi:hypothetical protein